MLLSLANQRSDCTRGDTMGAKNESTTRIYGLNVNGQTLDRRGGQFDVSCMVMEEVQADVICGQEHNLDSDQTAVRSIVCHTIRNHWQRSTATFGTALIPLNKMYKPGGTFMARTGFDHTNQFPMPSPKDCTTETFPIPSTLHECIDQLKETKQQVKTIVNDSFAQRDSERRERILDLEASAIPRDKKSATIL